MNIGDRDFWAQEKLFIELGVGVGGEALTSSILDIKLATDRLLTNNFRAVP